MAVEYNRSFRNMRGVSFSNTNGNDRYSYLENMYRDYDGERIECIESVPGFRKIASLGGRINGIFSQRSASGVDYTLVHSGESLYRFRTDMIDSLGTISPIGRLKDKKSSAFTLGVRVFILDGDGIVSVSGDGEVSYVDGDSDLVYVPCTYLNSERLEQRNLLTRRFYEKYVIGSAETVSYGTDGLRFSITDEERGLCAAVGLRSDFRGRLNIPSYATIGSKKYRVDEICDRAFCDHTGIMSLKIGEGVYRIGKHAFSGCTSLDIICCPRSLGVIDSYAFSDCDSVNALYLGASLERLGESIFENTALATLGYEGSGEEFSKIENSEQITTPIAAYGYDMSMTVEIPISTYADEITAVYSDGEAIASYTLIRNSEGRIKSIIYSVSDKRLVDGRTVTVHGISGAESECEVGSALGFLKSRAFTDTEASAIFGCKICESFDDRVFLSGNERLAGAVFFSSGTLDVDGRLYFGIYDYFSDGVGISNVSSMLASADSLLVFKQESDGGSIFYHTPYKTGDNTVPKAYPAVYVHNGISSIGSSISYYDDPIFLCSAGAYAIEKQRISLERSVACRSSRVNPRLLSEDLSRASLAVWCGYLAIGTEGRIYLADYRSTYVGECSAMEYDWFFLGGIGAYDGATRVYRYASIAPDGYHVHSTPDAVATAEVYSENTGSGLVYYVREGAKKYALYPTEEMSGGVFHPLSILYSPDGRLLFFGTEHGELCVFNNDKRGTPPQSLINDRGFDPEEYKKTQGRKIRAEYYAFDNHRATYAARIGRDDCSLPDKTKSTVKHSMTLRCSLEGGGRISCGVRTDRSGYEEHLSMPSGTVDFSAISFDALVFDGGEEPISISIGEKEKGWIDKEIRLEGSDYCTPIAIESIGYRYTLKGRIKHS